MAAFHEFEIWPKFYLRIIIALCAISRYIVPLVYSSSVGATFLMLLWKTDTSLFNLLIMSFQMWTVWIQSQRTKCELAQPFHYLNLRHHSLSLCLCDVERASIQGIDPLNTLKRMAKCDVLHTYFITSLVPITYSGKSMKHPLFLLSSEIHFEGQLWIIGFSECGLGADAIN